MVNCKQHLTNLEWLWLFSTLITGNLSSISKLIKLKLLTFSNHLAYNTISGSIESLSNLVNLEMLSLTRVYNVYGDISNLRNCTKLIELNINDTKITGNISAFANYTKLTSIYINDTQIAGDISVFRNMTGLLRLIVNNA